MNITDISPAKSYKFNLTYEDPTAVFLDDALIRLDATQDKHSFMVTQYGDGITDSTPVLCSASNSTADYLYGLKEGEKCQTFRCLFAIEGQTDHKIEVQAYTFQTITEYRTPIVIAVSDDLASRVPKEKLMEQYVWEQLGSPALFCMNYADAKRRSEAVRFINGRRSLVAERRNRGLLATKATYIRNKFNVPVDIFVAPEVRFVSARDQTGEGARFLDDIQAISNPSSYFARWEAYNALSRKLVKKESNDFGIIPYELISSLSGPKGTRFTFGTKDEIDEAYVGRELGVTISDARGNGKQRERLVAVGTIVRISGKQLTTNLEYDDMEIIPKKGKLKLNMSGNEVILKRRETARDRMVTNRTPIQGLVSLIESGRSGYDLLDTWGTDKAVTEKLRRNFPRAASLNAEQTHAIEIAVNTPDIALIQGPPGTGKTTVIKAICERFREIFEQRELQAQAIDPSRLLNSPRILITSFQNEAVDNAISDPLPRDIPAFRKTSKRATDNRREQYSRALEQWFNNLRDTISASIDNRTINEYAKTRNVLDDAFLSYKNAGEPIDMAAKLIERYLSFVDIPYPSELVAKAEAIMAAAAGAGQDIMDDPIVAKIESQRTSADSFADDGLRNARRLAAYIRISDDMEIADETMSAIEGVCDGDYTDDEFAQYVNAVEKLRTEFCKRAPTIGSEDKEAISSCIMALSEAFATYYANTLSTLEDKKSIVLHDFLERLEQDYEAVVEKYSMTTAATCQASMDLHDNAEKIYDLVIVDEAARANPLDLFIPMSMGKRLVLVGDQKQLPHMLEPDIVKMLADDPEFETVTDIEVSLFERLFNMFARGTRPKAVKLTQQYRMHPDICRFVSESFYDGLLETAKDITPDMRSCPHSINDGKPLAFIDIPISNGKEVGGVSKTRRCEVDAIGKAVKHILREDRGRRIGVITFYSAQAKLIHDQLADILDDEERDYVETGTVDAFQGKEFDYVLLSCVRSNMPKDGSAPRVGFLEKPNRLCVAFSRAIRQLAVYGDARTLRQVDCFARLHEICGNGGGYLATH